MKYLSVCSGIEAASVAWHPLGWKPLAFSEIEAFPRAVLEHHYPHVPLHGDFTVLKEEQWITDADVLVGGTPCQAFSVAGLRKSLGDDRGNLSLEFIKLADAIDAAREAQGRDPCIVVWENVPGVLSVKDNAFGCFIAALAGDVAPIDPPRGKWSNAGVVDGPQRTVAWRILDAQYFGLAQRRRRVFVVASARDGFDPAAVLLEFEGVRRDTPPRREAGKVAPTIPSRSTAGGGLGTDFDLDGGVITLAHGQGGAEVACERSPTLTCIHEAPIAAIPVTHSLRAEGFDASEDGTGRGTPLVPVTYSIMPQNSGKDYKAREVEVAQPIMAGGPVGGNQGGDYILQPVAFAQNTRDEVRLQGGDGQITGALAAEPGMKQTTYVMSPISSTDGSTHALGCGSKGGQASVAVGVFFAGQGAKAGSIAYDEHISPTLKASDSGTNRTPSVLTQAVAFRDTADCLTAAYGTKWNGNASADNGSLFAAQHMAVRRLTPRECEALQGFPPDYTLIPWKKKPAAECPDGPRYKALGNSMAVPVMRWIGQRIARALA